MNLLMTADTVGGVWTYALELARVLEPYDVRIVLATMGVLPSAEQCDELRSAPNVELHASRFKLEWMDDPWEDVRRAGDWLMRLESRVRPDVVHLNGYAHAALPWSAPVVVVGHSCVMSWWEAVKGEQAPASWNAYYRAVAEGLHSADLVLAPTRAMLDALVRNYGPPCAAWVIHNGRDPRLFQPAPKERFVFTAGRVWDEAKNVAALERIAPRVEWPVCVAGEEERPGGDAARHRNLRLLGRLAPQAMPHWFARAAIYALPARYEPFGLSALEAGLCGCALVLGDIPSLREVWGDAAVFVPPDDPRALERRISELIHSDDLRSSMAARARARALEFTPQRMAEGYMAGYRRIADRARSAESGEQGDDELSTDIRQPATDN